MPSRSAIPAARAAVAQIVGRRSASPSRALAASAAAREATCGGTAPRTRSPGSPYGTSVRPVARSATNASISSVSRHQILVVAVRLVELEHRELGVVLRRDPLVPEVARDLVHALHAADRQPLQVQLRRDPQVQIHVERVVVRHERPRHRAARDRLHDRRLDLEIAAIVEEARGWRRARGSAPRTRAATPRSRSGRDTAGDSGSRRPAGRATSPAAGGGTCPGTRDGVAQIVSSLVRVRNRCPETPT